MSDVTLSSSTRSTLLALQSTTRLMDETSSRLATGKKVNSALDGATAFFTAKGLTDRAGDLASRKDGITNAINTVQVAVDALEGAEDLLKQMKGIAEGARDNDDMSSSTTEFNNMMSQIDNLLSDASFNGVNLVKSSSDSMTVKFNEDGTNKLTVAGKSSDVDSLGVSTVTDWDSEGALDASISEIEAALTSVRNNAEAFGTSASILKIREDFTTSMISNLKGGAADLVNADMNEEGANMTALQTSQQLGTISLSLAQQSSSSVLSLF